MQNGPLPEQQKSFKVIAASKGTFVADPGGVVDRELVGTLVTEVVAPNDAERTKAEMTLAVDAPPWTPPEWMSNGFCRGKTNLFFAPHAERPQTRARREAQARLICEQCPALEPCRDYARLNREYGFWGGESEQDRACAGYAVPWPLGVPRRRGSLAATG